MSEIYDVQYVYKRYFWIMRFIYISLKFIFRTVGMERQKRVQVWYFSTVQSIVSNVFKFSHSMWLDQLDQI